MSKKIEKKGDLTSVGKIRWQRTLSNLVLKIGEGEQKTAANDCTAAKVSKVYFR